MTPEDMAALHRLGFSVPRPWSAAEFRDLLSQDGVFSLTCEGGFVLGRLVTDEAELLTITIAPDRRRQGHASALLARFLDRLAALGATRCFLEVAADNAAARALYETCGFEQVGQRRGYYRHPDGTSQDAIVMVRLPPQAVQNA